MFALFACALAGHYVPEPNYYHSKPHDVHNVHDLPHHFAPEPAYHYVDHKDAHAQVKSLHSDVKPDGFDYGFDTTNGIRAVAHGDEHNNVHGEFEWVDPAGKHVVVKYVADENGYHPSSEWLPTPPPVPEAILKSLEYNRVHGSHDESKYNVYDKKSQYYHHDELNYDHYHHYPHYPQYHKY